MVNILIRLNINSYCRNEIWFWRSTSRCHRKQMSLTSRKTNRHIRTPPNNMSSTWWSHLIEKMTRSSSYTTYVNIKKLSCTCTLYIDLPSWKQPKITKDAIKNPLFILNTTTSEVKNRNKIRKVRFSFVEGFISMFIYSLSSREAMPIRSVQTLVMSYWEIISWNTRSSGKNVLMKSAKTNKSTVFGLGCSSHANAVAAVS